MTRSSIAAAVARGATVVTPNKRLAREIVARHDEAQLASARAAWPAARAMPWHAFVGELWQRALDAQLELPAQRLSGVQAAHLWQRIVTADLEGQPLMDAGAAASLAEEAWERVHAYGEGGESWRGFDAVGPEIEAFVRWAGAFERETRRYAALDLARAPDAVAGVAASLPGVADLDVAFVGFVEYSPQQHRLQVALVSAGARVECLDDDDATTVARGRLFKAATPHDELVCALAWARARAHAHPAARIGIVVHDLHQRRGLIQALAEDVLCPGLQWPGREGELRPYDISAGGALADVPVIATALDLVGLAHGPLDRERAGALLRSRYLPGDAGVRATRTAAERHWLEAARQRLGLRAIASGIVRFDEALAARWRELGARATLPAEASPRHFVEAWRQWLDAAGWCDGTALDAAERAARGAWSELLTDFVRLTAVAPRMTRADALRALREAAQARPFEPEAPGARVRILGVLEAAGLTFDAVWVAGLAADAWPRAPEPNPLLPIAWQRERNVPRATPVRELAFARALTARLDASAPEVVFSYAERVDDHVSLPSPLIARLPGFAEEIARPVPPALAMFAGSPGVERQPDERAPAWPEGAPLRNGAALIEAQSACPFQAVGRYRLRAEAWPGTYAGLKPTERGKFVHAAFAAFWREVRDQAMLNALGEAALDAQVASAVAAGRTAVDDALWDALPPVVAAVEAGHVGRVMKRWLLEVDRGRPAFCVESTEAAVTLTLAGHPVTLRIDRVDSLATGARAIIDYKTGRAVAARHWFGERPQAPQLGLYAMALGDAANVAALAYAQLKPGQVRPLGLADVAATWPGLLAPSELKGAQVADWQEALRQLHEGVVTLAQAVHDGDARVVPRDTKVCTRCDLRPLCRIAAVDEGDDVDDDAEAAA